MNANANIVNLILVKKRLAFESCLLNTKIQYETSVNRLKEIYVNSYNNDRKRCEIISHQYTHTHIHIAYSLLISICIRNFVLVENFSISQAIQIMQSDSCKSSISHEGVIIAVITTSLEK